MFSKRILGKEKSPASFSSIMLAGLTAATQKLADLSVATQNSRIIKIRCKCEVGATHGLAHTLTQMAYFRPSNRHARYQNLYFVGASTHPSTGIPTAMVSGRLASERIKDELHE
jgi:phytoene dehydrogenase-like protein